MSIDPHCDPDRSDLKPSPQPKPGPAARWRSLLSYLAVLVIALLLAASLYGMLLVTGCGGPEQPSHTGSDVSGRVDSNWAPQDPAINQWGALSSAGEVRPQPVLAGSAGDLSVASADALAAGEVVTLTWTPPPGSSNFQFGAVPPESGGPPFVWHVATPVTPIHVQFALPNLAPGQTEMTVLSVLEVESGGMTNAAALATHVTQAGPTVMDVALSTSAAPPETMKLWNVGRFIDPKGFTLTTELCDDWIGRMRSDRVFAALRVPIDASPFVTASAGVPMAAGGLYSNSLQLGDYAAPAPAITVPLTLRAERFTYLANALPPSPDEMWVALGLDPNDSSACPAGLSASPNSWGIMFRTRMNLASQANDCQGCIFPLYYCYEGDESPLPYAGASNRVLLEASSVQGAGITCVGPQSLRLGTETSTWSLGGTSSAAVTPTQTISLMHYIAAPGAPVTVTLSHNGALGVNWRIYAGDSKHPDLGVPIDGPVAVQKNKTSFFWLISDPVPTSGVSGSQSLIVTATSVISPTDLRWRGDVIWVGSWEAPPPSGYDMYLPAVLR